MWDWTLSPFSTQKELETSGVLEQVNLATNSSRIIRYNLPYMRLFWNFLQRVLQLSNVENNDEKYSTTNKPVA